MIRAASISTRTWATLLTAALALLGVLAVSAAAQQGGAKPETVSAALDRSRVAVGDSALLTVTVDGADADSAPVAPTVPGLSIQYLDAPRSTGSFLQIVNGRQTSRTWVNVQYRFRVTPLRNGKFGIPPIAVSVAGQVINTRPLTLIAAEPEANPDFLVEIEVLPKVAYVGEPVLLRTTWYVTSNVNEPSFNLPGIERLRVSAAPDPRPPGTNSNDPHFARIPFIGGPMYGVVAEVERKDGRRFTAVTMDIVVTASAPGTYALGPMRAAFNAGTDRGPSNLGLFPGRGQRVVIASNAASLEVKPLPTQGKPPGFDTTGIVGEYRLQANATPTTVRAGDPIDLLWRVSGTVTASLVPPAVLTSQRELAERFRVPVEPVVARVAGRDAVFQAAIRARPGATRIPPLTLSVFDTRLKQYRVLKSEPIELNILPGGLVSADEPVGSSAHDGFDAPAMRPIGEAAAAVDTKAMLADRALMGVALVPPAGAALVIAGMLGWRRWNEDPGSQSRRAARRALKALRRVEPARADAADQAAAALRSFQSRVARIVGPGHESVGAIEKHIDRLDRRRFPGRPIAIDRKDLEEIGVTVRGVVAASSHSPGAGTTVAARVGVWLGAGLVMLAATNARASEPQTALNNLRAAESLAASDPAQAKAIAATAIDELLVLAGGPPGRAAPVHLALARGYGVTGDVGRQQLALRRAQRLSPWISVGPEVVTESGSAAGAASTAIGAAADAPVPLAWAGYVRVIDAPIRLGVLAGMWIALWGAIVMRVAIGKWGGRTDVLIGCAAVGVVLAAVSVGLDAIQTCSQRDEAVILKPVTPRAGPDDVVFAPVGAALSAGSLVRIAEDATAEPGWLRVHVGGGGSGGETEGAEPMWIPAAAAERVVP